MNTARIVRLGAVCLTFVVAACQDVVPPEPSSDESASGEPTHPDVVTLDPRSPAPRDEAPPWLRSSDPPPSATHVVKPPSAATEDAATAERSAEPHHAIETDAGAVLVQPVVPHPTAPASFADLVERVQPAVVNIYTEQIIPQRQLMIDPVYGPYAVTRPKKESSLGSGFIVDDAGYILTNTHVIQGAQAIRISTSDGREFPATVVGTDPLTDIALIRVQPFEGMTVLPMGDANKVRVGDWLMAVGNPFGLQSTVTVGILSARGRRDVPVGGDVRYVDFLQTDASINPGNSGGPLIAMDGTVIGINTAINAAGQGIGFAVPINMAARILDDLRSTGSVTRSWLGLQLTPVQTVDEQGQRVAGARVAFVVPQGPAALAGLRVNDIITKFGEHSITSSVDLPWLASTAGVGQTVLLNVLRDGHSYQVPVTMGALPN